MSREIIDHIKMIAVAANELYIDACDGKSIDVGRAERDRICDALKEIERLLTAEREKVLGEILAFNTQLGCTPQEGYKNLPDALRDTKHLIAQQREKVREMCAEKVETTIYYREVDVLEMDTARLREQIARDIRQLDLTKLDEGKG